MKASVAVRIGLAIAALLTSGAVGAQAQDGPGFGEHRPPMERALGPRGDHGHWWNNPQMVEKLKLTDEQRKAMDAILLEHREKLVDLHASLDKAELQMEPLMRNDQPNEGQILAQIDKIAQARADLEKANARFLLAIRGKLTPEQWKTLQTERENRMERRGWDHGDHGRGGVNHERNGMHDAPPPPGGPQGMLDRNGPEGPSNMPAPVPGGSQ